MESDEQNNPQQNNTNGFQQPPAPVVQNPVIQQQYSTPQPMPVPQQGPMMQQPGFYQPPVQPVVKKGSKLKLALIGGFLSILILGGGAAAYMQYVVNSPDKVWQRALASTAEGIETLASTQDAPWPGTTMEGTFSLSSPVAADGSMKGLWYGSDGSMTFDVGAAGLRVNGEMRTIKADGASSPDVYMKMQGMETVLGLLDQFSGVSGNGSVSGIVEEVDDQWFTIDRTLIDQLLSSGGSSGSALTSEDMQKITQAMMKVMRETLLATNDKAVFKVVEQVGKEDFEGTSTYKFTVGVNKDNLKNFLTELQRSLKETKFPELLEATGQSYDEVFALEGLMTDIDAIDLDKAKADVWVEANGRYVRNVRIYNNNDQSAKTYLDIGMPYEGGDIIPLQVKITTEQDGSQGTASFGSDFHTKGESLRFWLDVDLDIDLQKVAAKLDFKAAKSNEQVNVQKPEGARNVYDLIGIFSESQSGGLDDSLLLDDNFDRQFTGTESQLFDDIEL